MPSEAMMLEVRSKACCAVMSRVMILRLGPVEGDVSIIMQGITELEINTQRSTKLGFSISIIRIRQSTSI